MATTNISLEKKITALSRDAYSDTRLVAQLLISIVSRMSNVS